MVKSLFLFILIGFWRTAFAGPEPIFQVHKTMDGPALGPFMEYLVDDKGQYDEASIAATPDAAWQPLQHSYRNFGHLRTDYRAC
jgi:hypothetical protein